MCWSRLWSGHNVRLQSKLRHRVPYNMFFFGFASSLPPCPCPLCNREEACLISVFKNVMLGTSGILVINTYLLWRKYKVEKELYTFHSKYGNGLGPPKIFPTYQYAGLRWNVQAQEVQFCRVGAAVGNVVYVYGCEFLWVQTLLPSSLPFISNFQRWLIC